MLRWIVRDVESPYGSVATVHWAVGDADDAHDTSVDNNSQIDKNGQVTNHHSHNMDDNEDEAMHRRLESAEDQLGAVLWNSNSVALCYIHDHVLHGKSPKGRRIVELGAGVGCLGIALAMGGAHVAITDLKELVPLMERNIEINEDKISRNEGSCTALTWRWGPPAFARKTANHAQRQRKEETSRHEGVKRGRQEKSGNGSSAVAPTSTTMGSKRDGELASNEASRYTAPSPSLTLVQKAIGGAGVDYVILCDALYGNPRDWPQLLYTLTELMATNPACEVVNFCEQRVEDVEGSFLDLLRVENAQSVPTGELSEDGMMEAMRRRRGVHIWHSVTEVVNEGASELGMTIRATRIRWERRSQRHTPDAEDGKRRDGEEHANDEPPKKKRRQ